MRAIEEAAIASGEVTGLELMERAGRGVVEAIFEEWPELRATSHRAVVLCGPGNNGGDGFVVARLLKDWGWEVEVFLYGDAEKLPPDAQVNYERWLELGEVHQWDATAIEGHVIDCDLAVDSVFGTGLSRPMDYEDRHDVHDGFRLRCFEKRPSVAIDFPSGLNADTGVDLGHSFPALLTVTFHKPKIGHYVGEGPIRCGKIKVCDIGLGKRWRRDAPHLLDNSMSGLSFLGKDAVEHKYTHGHALVLSGGPGKTGAARLAARGALRIGAGLVTVACPQKALWEVATQVTAIMCHSLDGPPGLRELLEDERMNALCLGPGMGLGADTQALVLEALKATTAKGPGSSPGQDNNSETPAAPTPEPGPRRGERGVVLDADALTRFARNPQVLFDALHDTCVLTPHAGEFKRLFPDIAEKLDAPATTGPAYSKVDATREAAGRAGCTVLFKGSDTVIADPSGRCAINSSAYDRAAPWLATAGSGDVLAGFITGLLARGFPPMQAAETAAWLHTECALSFGPGLIAEDIPEELPKVFKTLL